MTLWTLLIVFQFKHYIADYILQGEYMLGKFKTKGWVLPLASHCGVHLLFTLIISNIADKKSSNVKFWYALGFDQLIHHLTDILIIYMIMRTV